LTKRKKADPGLDARNEAVRKRLASKFSKESAEGELPPASWENVSPTALHSLITEVSLMRGAVLAGIDRLGVGLTLSVFVDGEKVVNRWYRGDPEGVESLNFDLEDIVQVIREE